VVGSLNGGKYRIVELVSVSSVTVIALQYNIRGFIFSYFYTDKVASRYSFTCYFILNHHFILFIEASRFTTQAIMSKYLVIVTLLFCWTKFAISTTTSITIGGVFNIFDSNGIIANDKLQHLSAFLMAVDEINQNTTILPNIQLNYVIRSAYGDHDSITIINEFTSQGVVGVVNALTTDDESYALNEAANAAELVLFNSDASIDTTQTAKYAYSFETNPAQSYQSTVIRSLYCAAQIKRIIIYATLFDENLQLIQAMNVYSQCDIDIVSTYLFPVTATDFAREINKGIADSVTSVFVFMAEDTAARFIQQAYDLGLVRKGVSMVGSANLKSSSFIGRFADPSVLKGFITFNDFPLYSLYTSAKGVQFFQDFVKLNSSILTCARYADTTGYHYLYRNGSSSSGPCVGLDTSTFSSSPATLTTNLAYTYDSVYALVYALDALVKSSSAITADNLVTKVFDLNFAGASGAVSYSKGDSTLPFNTRGNRVGGLYFMMNNYQIAGNAFYPTLVTSVEHGPLGCVGLPDGFCKSYIFNSVDDTIPNGYPAYALATPPAIIRIGGIFNLYDDHGVANKQQVECLAAFLMAVRDVNNKVDGMFDHILPNSQVKVQTIFGSDFTNLVTKAGALTSDYFGAGVTGVVSALSSDVNLAVNKILTQNNVMQVNSVATEVQQG
jgi:ABC-type branched-subunit amino acid transport system substrate-binding protein